MVQTGVHQGFQVSGIFQSSTVGIQTGNLALVFSVGDQLWQIKAHGWLAAGEYNVRNGNIPQPIKNLFPLTSFHLRELA